MSDKIDWRAHGVRIVRSDQGPIVVNLAIEPVEKPETIFWVDPIHPHP